MSSEIRVNKINSRAGLGTVTYTDTGIIVSGVSTASNFKTGTSDLHSAGINVAYADVDDFVDIGNVIKLGNAGVVTATTFSTSNVDVTTDKIVVGTGVTIEANQVATGQATFTGIVTASAFKLSDGSNVGGVESDAQGNTVGGTGAGNALDGDTYSNTLFGQVAGYVLDSGDGNTAVGRYALRNGTSATSNSLFGYGAGRAIVSGNQNTLIGYEAGTSVTGNHHVAVGYQALKSTTSGENNTALGYKAGTSNQSGEFNVFIGYLCGFQNNSGDNNNFMGYNAGFSNNSGHKNVAIGHQSLYSNSSNDFNTMLGHRAGYNVTGSNNTVLGGDAGYGNLTSGSNNIIIGYDAESSAASVSNEITLGNSNVSHFRIPGIGVSFSEGGGVVTGIMTASSFKLLDGSAVGGVTSDAQGNTVGGSGAGDSFTGTDAENNTLFGKDAGTAITSADSTTAVGKDAGKSITTGSYNHLFGIGAGDAITTGTNNTIMGHYAGSSFQTSSENTIIGGNAGGGSSLGSYNVIVGKSCNQNNEGSNNVFIGQGAIAYRSGTASNNVIIGQAAADFLTNGNHNAGVGQNVFDDISTGSDNSALGSNAGDTLTTGSNNLFLGHDAFPSSATVSNEVTIGDANIDKFRVPGLGLEFAKDHTYGVVGGRKNWFDNGSFDCIGGRRANTSMDYGNHHAYGWVTDRFQSRNSVQWTRSSNVPAGKGFSYSTQSNGVGGRLVQAVELPDYGDMGVFAPGSYWCVSVWSTAGLNQSGQAFSYDLGSTKTDISIVHPSSGGVYQSTGETASGTSTGTFTRYYMVFQMPNSIISTASSAYWTWAFTAAGYHTGFQLERVPTATSKPTPYEHVHPSVTIARCRRYCYQNVNSRLMNGYKRHDSNIHWAVQFPVPPTHMPSGSNQSVSPYGIHLHDGGMLTNFQGILQNPGVNSLAISEFDYRSGRFLIVGSTSYSPTHLTVPSWESQEYEIMHGHF